MEGRTLFLVAYYWPPAGGPGVQRWLGFTRYLAEEGWDITAVVPKHAAYPIEDRSLDEQVSTRITVLRVPIVEPAQLGNMIFPKATRRISSGIIAEKNPGSIERILLGIRANAFIPDARVGWVSAVVRKLRPLLNDKDIPTLITTGPPHSVHLIGRRLKEGLPNLTWVADFRDPWTGISYHSRLPLWKYSQRRHKEMEQAVLRSADRILVTSQATRRQFETITDRPVSVFTNGFDFAPVNRSPDPVFRLLHMGSLLTERNPEFLWKALGEFRRGLKDREEKVELELWGTVSQEVLEEIRLACPDTMVHYRGYADHKDVPDILARAQILLLLESDLPDKKEIIPGKLFEYLQSRRPVIAIGPQDWEAGRLVERLKAGVFHTYGQSLPLIEALRTYWSDYLRNNRCIPPLETHVEPFSRKAISQRLSAYLHGIGH